MEQLSGKVTLLESRSSLELVVVVAKASGSYRELDHQNGFVTAMAVLLVAIHSPWEFAPDMLLFWLVLGYALGLGLSTLWDGPRRLLTSPLRRRAQVVSEARGAFVEKRVLATRDRSGMLLYLSDFERLAVFVPDLGVEAKVPRALLNDLEAEWGKARSREAFETSVLQGLAGLADPFAEALPRREDDEDELSNEIFVASAGRR